MAFDDPARTAALHLLRQLESSQTRADHLLSSATGKLPPRDRRFVRQLVLGVLRWRGRIDWLVDHCLQKPIAAQSVWLRQILRLGVFQLLWLDRVPPRAAVHSSVELAARFSHKGVRGLVNGVLRRIQREAAQIPYPDPKEDIAAYLSVFHSHPRQWVERWLAAWGSQRTEALLQANNTQAPLFIRLNPASTNPEQLPLDLAANACQPLNGSPVTGFYRIDRTEGLFATKAFKRGHFQVQDINAGLAAALLAPAKGDRVLDTCSAPGGKATQLASLVGPGGLVVAADITARGLGLVRDNAQRLGLGNIRLLREDGRRSLCGPFDRILVDAPCSGTGVFNRHPEARWRKTPNQLANLARRQRAILNCAFARLRPGGALVYSTCSLEAEENAQVVENFLATAKNAHLQAAADFFPKRPWAGTFVQTLPGREPGDGSFAARIIKRPR